MRPLYVSATGQDSGKTTLICGLYQLLRKQHLDAGYFKPVGQRYVRYKDQNVDKDAALFLDAFNLPDDPHTVSPIAIEHDFTTKFILNPDVSSLEAEILKCGRILSEAHPALIIEGTGHAGVGSCFGLSNARVAQLLGANVIIITTGGIGRPIDEIALSLSLFRAHNVNVAGVIFNRVIPEKLDKIRSIAGKGLELLGTKLLGAIPFEPIMSYCTMQQIAREFKYKAICGENDLSRRIDHTVVGAMEAENLLQYLQPNTLVITPGDRVDNILLAMALSRHGNEEGRSISGLILTGGLRPQSPTIFFPLCKSGIPVLLSDDDTFTVSAKMKEFVPKICAQDSDKIKTIPELVSKYVDLDQFDNLTTHS